MKRKSLIQLLILLFFILVWSLLILFYGAEGLIDFLGVHNSYIVLAVVGLLGGVSTFTSASFYTTLSTLAVAGLNPFYLGLIGGLAVTVGDSLYYYIGKKGNESLPKKLKKKIMSFSNWMKKQPKWRIQLVTFVYSGLTPFPSDLLTISLGLTRYRYRHIILPLMLGNILLTTIVALSVSRVF